LFFRIAVRTVKKSIWRNYRVLGVMSNADDVAKGVDKFAKNIEKKLPSRLEEAGVFLEGKMVEKISIGLSPVLKPVTIARKGSSKPLIDTGELIGQIDHRVSKNSVEVGVFGSRAKIARHHEFGAPRANIPERSFMRSAFGESKRKIVKMMK
jgi:phage gpG-like protein